VPQPFSCNPRSQLVHPRIRLPTSSSLSSHRNSSLYITCSEWGAGWHCSWRSAMHTRWLHDSCCFLLVTASIVDTAWGTQRTAAVMAHHTDGVWAHPWGCPPSFGIRGCVCVCAPVPHLEQAMLSPTCVFRAADATGDRRSFRIHTGTKSSRSPLPPPPHPSILADNDLLLGSRNPAGKV
jgi:hypothetical protein